MRIDKGLAVQSYCFRSIKDTGALIDAVKTCGVNVVELCAAHVNFADDSSHGTILGRFRDSGVKIVSTGVNRIGADPAAVEKAFAFTKNAGARHMSVDFDLAAVPACYRTAEKLADKYDLRLGIHNHGGGHWLGNLAMIRKVLSETSERVGLCIDTAWALHSHEDPVRMVETAGRRLFGLHLKDFTFDRAGKHTDVVVGTGNLDLAALRDALNKASFEGCAVVEYEGDVNHPIPSVSECVRHLKAAVPEFA